MLINESGLSGSPAENMMNSAVPVMRKYGVVNDIASRGSKALQDARPMASSIARAMTVQRKADPLKSIVGIKSSPIPSAGNDVWGTAMGVVSGLAKGISAETQKQSDMILK